jgi:hypothetical protein
MTYSDAIRQLESSPREPLAQLPTELLSVTRIAETLGTKRL